MLKTFTTIRDTFIDPFTNTVDWTSVRLIAQTVICFIGAIICFVNAIILINL